MSTMVAITSATSNDSESQMTGRFEVSKKRKGIELRNGYNDKSVCFKTSGPRYRNLESQPVSLGNSHTNKYRDVSLIMGSYPLARCPRTEPM